MECINFIRQYPRTHSFFVSPDLKDYEAFMEIYPPHIRPSILKHLQLSTPEWQTLPDIYYRNTFTISANEGHILLSHIQTAKEGCTFVSLIHTRHALLTLEYVCSISVKSNVKTLRSCRLSHIHVHDLYQDEIDHLIALSQRIRTHIPNRVYIVDLFLIFLGSLFCIYGIWQTFFA
ncbi:MAG: hypothetical protein ABEI13_03930 [Candidatus Paceibacteria bacterium]